MITRWHRLNVLIPEPLCRMDEDSDGELQITEWVDDRTQPSDEAIDAVTDQQVTDNIATTAQEDKFNQDIIKAVGLTLKDFCNEIMAGRTKAISNLELKTKFKSYL